MVIFDKLEIEAKKELIKLYSDYIIDLNDPTLEQRGLDCDQKYGALQVLSKKVAFAGSKASDIALKELSVAEAKEILNTLK